MKKSCVVFALLIAASITASPLGAQQMKWKKLADRLLTPSQAFSYYGGIKAKGDIILAGTNELKLSTDGGNTWKDLILPGLSTFSYGITGVDIYDNYTFACISYDNGIYSTSDGGVTWSLYEFIWGESICFDNSRDRIFAISPGPYPLLIIKNGNSRIVELPIPNVWCADIQVGSDGNIYILGSYNNGNGLFSSSDKGQTWVPKTNIIPQTDCLSFIVDQTDMKRFLIINEDWALRENDSSSIFLTSDNGETWKQTLSKPLGSFTYLMGNATTGCHDYFVGSVDGILRSGDKGLSWMSIGGPKTPVDTRTICALDDSTIYAIDKMGSIWVTVPEKRIGITSAYDITSTFTDTIGGDVVIRIVSHYTGQSFDAEFTIHYDTSYVEYHGVIDAEGKDHTIGHPDGMSARISMNSGSDSVLFAKFSFYPVDSVCTTVRIDSITPPLVSDGCTQVVASPIAATICSPAGCGRGVLARFVRYGQMPTFSIKPNPTTGEVTLRSSEPFGDAVVEICNALGMVMMPRVIGSQATSAALDLSALPAGMYFVRIHSPRTHCVLPVVVGR